jgi:hypothetical protein
MFSTAYTSSPGWDISPHTVPKGKERPRKYYPMCQSWTGLEHGSEVGPLGTRQQTKFSIIYLSPGWDISPHTVPKGKERPRKYYPMCQSWTGLEHGSEVGPLGTRQQTKFSIIYLSPGWDISPHTVPKGKGVSFVSTFFLLKKK